MRKRFEIPVDLALPVFDQEFNGTSIQVVDARRLHKYLKVKSRFSVWISRHIKHPEANFKEGVHYFKVTKLQAQKKSGKNQGVTSPIKDPVDYFLTKSMCYDIGMMTRTQQGVKVRDYFKEAAEFNQRILAGDAKALEEVYQRTTEEGRNWLRVRHGIMDSDFEYKDVLFQQGCTVKGYTRGIDTINKNVLGGTSKEVAAAKELAPTARMRDSLTTSQLSVLQLSMNVASSKIKEHEVVGNDHCVQVSDEVSKRILDAIDGYIPVFK